jgi:hypothetical protein
MGCVGSTKGATPRNSQVKELSHVSTLESGTAVPTDAESRQMTRRYCVVAFLASRNMGWAILWFAGEALSLRERGGLYRKAV